MTAALGESLGEQNPAYRPSLALSFVSVISTPLTHLHWRVAERGPVTPKHFHGLCETTAGARAPASPVTLSALAWDQIRWAYLRLLVASREGHPPHPRYLWGAATSLRSMGHGPSRAGSGDAADPRACGAPRRATRPGRGGGAETEAMGNEVWRRVPRTHPPRGSSPNREGECDEREQCRPPTRRPLRPCVDQLG